MDGSANITFPILSLSIFIPIISAILIQFLRGEKGRNIGEKIVLATILFEGIIILILASSDIFGGEYQFVEKYQWIPFFNINYFIGIDSISFILLALTVIVYLIALNVSKKEDSAGLHKIKHTCFLVSFSGIIGVFLAIDTILLYLFWEMVIVPAFVLLRLFAEKDNHKVSLKFILYSLTGSVVMLAGFIFISLLYQSENYELSFSLIDWYQFTIPAEAAPALFLAFFLTFAIKVPIFPFHGWMPSSYTNAPMSLTIIMSGVLSKMGIYGIIRILLPLFSQLSQSYFSSFLWLVIIGSIYASLIAISSKSPKKILAYSSMAHLGIVVYGFFTLNSEAIWGSFFQTFNHGIISAALFFGLSVIATKCETNNYKSIQGIWKHLPVISSFFFIFTLAGVAFPGTSSFVAELSIFTGGYRTEPLLTFVAALTTIFSSIYMFNLVRVVIFGMPSPTVESAMKTGSVISIEEMFVFALLTAVIATLGIYPNLFNHLIESNFSGYINDFISSKTPIGKLL